MGTEGGVKNEGGADAAATGAAEGANGGAAAGGQPEHMEISVKSQDGEIVKFKVRRMIEVSLEMMMMMMCLGHRPACFV